VAAANCGAVKVAHELPGNSIASLAVIAGGTAATGFAAQSALTERMVWKWNTIAPELAWSAAVELPALLLLFWLMRRMSATRMTVRFVLAPLITILIGFVVQQPAIEPRTWLGLFLMTAAAIGILFAPDEVPEAGSSLLNLNHK
jgi:drug/metabolite transporter (DMT)-like permease